MYGKRKSDGHKITAVSGDHSTNMRSKLVHLITFFLLLTAASVDQTAGQAADVKTTLQTQLDAWHRNGKFPGAVLGVCPASGECFSLAVGISDRTSKAAMRPDSRMLAGSVGKTFAAATALQLVSAGKIGLDDKISKYLGDIEWFRRMPNADDVTVRQLMNHTSGLVRYEFKETVTNDLKKNPLKSWTPAERLSYMLDEKPPFAAGKGWEYSDTNYIVLGMIIEKATGKDFFDEADKRFIKKYKLKDTLPQKGVVMKGVVQGYAGSDNIFGPNDEMIRDGKFLINPQLEWTGGGYASNALDLARWAKLMYEAKAVEPKMLEQMLDGVAAPMLGRNAKYGLGVIIRQTEAGTSYGHSGFFPGYLTDMMYFPDHKVSIAVQVNTSVGRDLGKPNSRVLVEAMLAMIERQKTKTAAN